MNVTIQPYKDDYKEQLISVWEKSVRETHDFLLASDIDYYKGIVSNIDFHSFHVFCLISNHIVIGFIGVADTKIEMLFLSPEYIGKDYGRLLVDFAIKDLNAQKVDVNEQNQHAVSFYLKCGFIPYNRIDKDNEGKDYPILK